MFGFIFKQCSVVISLQTLEWLSRVQNLNDFLLCCSYMHIVLHLSGLCDKFDIDLKA